MAPPPHSATFCRQICSFVLSANMDQRRLILAFNFVPLLLLASLAFISCNDMERFIILFKGNSGITALSLLDLIQKSPKNDTFRSEKILDPVFEFNFTNFTGLVYEVPRTPNVVSFSGVVDAIFNDTITKNATFDERNFNFPVLLSKIELPPELFFLELVSDSVLWIERSRMVTTLATQSNAPWNLVRISEHIRKFPFGYR